MDVSLVNNVLEGTRQYFMGVPRQAQAESSGQSAWSTNTPLPEEGAPAQSGAPAPSSRPPSAAAAPPTTSTTMSAAVPPRPPSEPLEPEPHIIHKATVMREAAEKRREMPEVEDEEETNDALSPPSHIIRKPQRPVQSPAPAPAANCPSPSRPPSAALPPPPPQEPQIEAPAQYRQAVHRVPTPTTRPPDQFAPGRPPDPYTSSRPPEQYPRYHYESNVADGGRNSHGPPVASPQPSGVARQSPQTYARISSSMPHHTTSRLREAAAHSPPAQRYMMPAVQPPPPHNDRVPPIHHPQSLHPPQRHDVRSAAVYSSLQQRRDPSPYGRASTHYDMHPAVPPRKYDPQQAYPGYRPAPTPPQPIPTHRIETHHPVQYKQTVMESMSPHYAVRASDRTAVPPQPHAHDATRLPARLEYQTSSRNIDSRGAYSYPTASTSTARYASNTSVPEVQNTLLQSKSGYRPAAAPKSSYEYPTSTPVQTSPARSTVKPGYPNQQARMTVSVTSLVNQMNQTKHKLPHPATTQTQPLNQIKQKRESPLDLSVKTVKNSADSSTTHDDVIDSLTAENKTLSLQPRPSSSQRSNPSNTGYVASHKVDFAPNFNQYRDRGNSQNFSTPVQASHHSHHTPVRYNGAYETRRPLPESFTVESQNPIYIDQNKYSTARGRNEHVPRIDLTRPISDQRRPENRIRDDRHFIIEERKRPMGQPVSNIPEKIVRYETWTSDSRIDRISQSTKEQQELMSRPVYSYSSHKQFEAYQNEQKRPVASNIYREHYPHVSHRYPSNSYVPEIPRREPSEHVHHQHYYDKNQSTSTRHHVIQKLPSHRDVHPHHLEVHNGIPADKNVLSILRNSLETKQTGYVDPSRPAKHIPDLIVIDDVDDSVIEITDLTKDNDNEITSKDISKHIRSQNNHNSSLSNHIKMPRAVDSLQRDTDYQRFDNSDQKSKSPEYDVASRIRTKAELKVMPPSQDSNAKTEGTQDMSSGHKLLPKSQKQHLFNQIREDNLRLESVIKCETSENVIPEVKTEPMNIDEIEKDAEISIKTEKILESLEPENVNTCTDDVFEDDLDWASACDSFVEQLKTGCHKKKTGRKRIDTIEREIENKTDKEQLKMETGQTELVGEKHTQHLSEKSDIIKPLVENVTVVPEAKNNSVDNFELPAIEIKKEPLDEDEIKMSEPSSSISQSNKIVISEKEETKTENSKKDKKNFKENDKTSKNKNKSTPKKSEKRESFDSPPLSIIKQETIEKEPIKTIIKEESESTDDDEPLIKSKLLKEKELKLKEQTNKDELKNKEKEAKNREKEPKIKDKGPKNKEKDQKNKEKDQKIKQKELKIKDKVPKYKENERKLKEKELNYKLLKDLSEKSAYVKLECCDVDVNKNNRKSIESITKEKEEKMSKCKFGKQSLRVKGKSLSAEKNDKHNIDSSSDSDDDLSVATRLRVRKSVKSEDSKEKPATKTPVKPSQGKKQDSSSTSNYSTPVRKPGFGDGSDFHPGWEEELYRYKRSLRMPTRLIAIPRGRSGGPYARGSAAMFSRGATSLPDLDPPPLSPAPSSAPSAATDDLYSRRPDKMTMDSDLDSNSSCSVPNRLQYDSEASTSTVFSSSLVKKKSSSIVDVLIQKCGRKEESKKKSKDKEKDERSPKIIPKCSNTTELLPTPSLGLVKNGNKETLSTKKEKIMEEIYYLGAFRKETVAAFRNAFIKNTDGLIGATEEFSPVVLKTRTRTESRVLKHRATIKEVFGDERPASAPPSSCRESDSQDIELPIPKIEKEPEESVSKPKFKPKKIMKDKMKRSSSTIRDGLRSTKSLKRNDAKGRLLRLKKRNSLMKSLPSKRMKELAMNKHKKESNTSNEDKDKEKEDIPPEATEGNNKRRLKRLFGRRKFSSGFDYIRKKKKIIRKEDSNTNTQNKIRRQAPKPSPESEHDIHKEIKSWFINKSIGETHLHRAARLGYTDCVAYCLEKMDADPSAKDNAGFTPLHVAAARGHVRIARLLLQYGANVSAAAQGGIRPLHEACENCHAEVIRLLLAYGADPLLGTYAGQTPEELAEGPAAKLVRLHIADVQGHAFEPWRFPHPAEIVDYEEIGCDSLSSPPPASPPPPPDSMMEIQCTEAPLPPFYSLRTATGQPADGLWCLLQDVTNILQIKSKESLLKQIHCGSGSPKELLREIRTQEFLERAQCHQLLCAGEKVNVRASKVALIRVTDKLRQLLKIETILVS
ncbi:uncharacterized protein LOC106142867 [Amyelois transitella]|uniref:uncharacterized protein LOC106142867 n=1 Tax=Amyelois transitella TaxID=680683 RepID=UPI00298FDE18|nr:uncharacterized protein LOC106142867 [Amyelois transitella]XP_013200250.2 uncharacterized protein LOC106142867 [Amyelois transitella]XP_060801704.1 uncharacterized protein LOC106142867 [Amyelois transitella]